MDVENPNYDNEIPVDNNDYDIDDDDDEEPNNPDLIVTEDEFAERLGKTILKMRETQRLSMKSVNNFLNEAEEIIDMEHEDFALDIKSTLLAGGIDIDQVPGLNKKLNSKSKFKGGFGVLKDEYKQVKFFKDHFQLVEPVELRINKVHDRKSETYQYIPILKSIKALLGQEDILAEVLNPHTSQDEFMSDYCDGSNFKSHPLFGSDARNLQIQLYCDDFQGSNPLGNRIRKCKISAFYFVLGNISPKF